MSPEGHRLPFCAFNGNRIIDKLMISWLMHLVGGNDVFVDIGDKSWGVQVCQKFFGGIEGGKTLHIGDQFLSAGANDFKVRFSEFISI